MKRGILALFALALCITTLLTSFSAFATEAVTQEETENEPFVPSEPEASFPMLNRCKAGGVCNGETGEILYSMNENARVYPAATAKLMTALVVLEHYQSRQDTMITITEAALSDVSGVTVNLKQGETLSVRQLLACLVIGSANDAALVLARSIAGSVDGFVDLMNAKAEALGMTATVYQNPTGLHHDKMVTTVGDTLKLAAALYRQAEFVNLCSRQSFEIPATDNNERHLIHNRNYLVSDLVVPDYYDPNVNGMNYGSTFEAGGCVVASTLVDGTVYISAVFGGETETIVISEEHEEIDENGQTILVPEETKVLAHAFFEAKSLLDWAKESFTYYLIVNTSDIICEIPVRLGEGRGHVTLFPAERIELYLPSGLDPSTDLRTEYRLYDETLTAPVLAGTAVGTYSVYYLDQLVAQVELTTRSTVERSIWGYYAERAEDFLRSEAFARGALIALGILVLYALCMSVWRHHARKKALLRRRHEREEEMRRRDREKLDEWG